MNDKKNLEQLAEAIKRRNAAEREIAQIIGRPGQLGHVGEYVASHILGIDLAQSAVNKAIDGRFAGGILKDRSVDIKFYATMEGLLDISQSILPDYYLVLTGPKAPAISSRGTTRPWLISYVYLFEAKALVSQLKLRPVKIGVAASIAKQLWDAAELYPVPRNRLFTLSEEQRTMLALFSHS